MSPIIPGRGIPAGGVASPSNTPSILGRRALPAGRRAPGLMQLVTPHMSGFRPDHWDAMTELFAANLRRYLSGQALRNIVDKTDGY